MSVINQPISQLNQECIICKLGRRTRTIPLGRFFNMIGTTDVNKSNNITAMDAYAYYITYILPNNKKLLQTQRIPYPTITEKNIIDHLNKCNTSMNQVLYSEFQDVRSLSQDYKYLLMNEIGENKKKIEKKIRTNNQNSNNTNNNNNQEDIDGENSNDEMEDEFREKNSSEDDNNTLNKYKTCVELMVKISNKFSKNTKK